MKQLWHMIERYYPWLLLLLGVDCFCAVILWISDIQVFQTLIGLVVLTSILLFSAILFVLNKRENTHMELFRDFLSDPTICNEERLLSAISQKEGESVRFLASVLREYKNESNNMADALRDYEEYVEGWFDTFAPNNTWLKPGEMFRCPDMAKTLKEIAATKGESFYRGAIAEKIDAFFKKHNGFLTKEDLAAFKPEWVDPISVNYHGVDVWELPPNGHGITVLMALQILKDMKLGERDCVDTMHKQIEAMKLAMVDTAQYVAEPSYMKVSVDQLLSEKYAAKRRALINDQAIMPEPGEPGCPSTVYFCCADGEGNMVSFIQSNFRGFGSGIVVPGTGISLNDRAENFKFDENHANALAGGKRPYHTIIPGFLIQDGKPLGPFGIMGGWMQPQAHVQVVMNMIDWHLNPQQALDAPRWQWVGGKKVEVEQETPNYIIRQLQRMGHQIIVQPDPYHMGRGQVILRDENGVLCGATEKRTDGQIMSY